MPQRPEAVLENLRKRQFAPVYFLQGDEPYYIDLISDFIENNAIAEHERGFNQVVCYGKDVAVGTIITQARRFPMMAERQVVIVKEAQEIADLPRDDGQRRDVKSPTCESRSSRHRYGTDAPRSGKMPAATRQRRRRRHTAGSRDR